MNAAASSFGSALSLKPYVPPRVVSEIWLEAVRPGLAATLVFAVDMDADREDDLLVPIGGTDDEPAGYLVLRFVARIKGRSLFEAREVRSASDRPQLPAASSRLTSHLRPEALG